MMGMPKMIQNLQRKLKFVRCFFHCQSIVCGQFEQTTATIVPIGRTLAKSDIYH
jgi:hypothetical protein